MGVKKDDEQTGPAVDPFDVLDRLATALEGMRSAPQSNSEITERLAEALERVSSAQTEGAKLIAAETRRAHRPSNEVVPQRSVLNLQGERDFPKPKLKCVMMIPWLVDQDSVTREEVQLLNLLQPGEYVVSKMDGTKVKVSVRIDYGLDEITPSRLLMNNETAFNNDNQRWVPPLAMMLRQMLGQHKDSSIVASSRAVLTMDEEAALIEAEKLPVSV
jgi:hypothetical protein